MAIHSATVSSSELRDREDGRASSIWRALRHHNFQLFFGGQLISLTGTWMQSVAQSWLVYRLTGSAILLGLVGFASQIPVFLLTPLGGAVADRHNRHRILVATQSAAMLLAFMLAGLTLFHRVQVFHIFILAALMGLVNVRYSCAASVCRRDGWQRRFDQRDRIEFINGQRR